MKFQVAQPDLMRHWENDGHVAEDDRRGAGQRQQTLANQVHRPEPGDERSSAMEVS